MTCPDMPKVCENDMRNIWKMNMAMRLNIFCMCETSIEATNWFIQTIGSWCICYHYCTTLFS